MSSPTVPDLKPNLTQGLKALGLELPEARIDLLLQLLALLIKWNKSYNLTAVRDPQQMVPVHLLDSLAMMPFLQGNSVLDVGTGPGFPGLPLAIACPETQFTLLDSNAKKTRFITQAVMELGIQNVTVVQSRAEAFQPAGQYSSIITRAFASIPEMLAMIKHLCTNTTAVIAMKGQYPKEELSDWPSGFVCDEIRAVQVPELDAARHVVLISYEMS